MAESKSRWFALFINAHSEEMRKFDLRPIKRLADISECRDQPLSLWGFWWNAILLLRPAFSRLRTFMWFATIVARPDGTGGIALRPDQQEDQASHSFSYDEPCALGRQRPSVRIGPGAPVISIG
jgi:hypothetical protein